MKKKLLQFALAAVALLPLTSCFNDNDDYEYSNDVSITAFSLNAVNRYYTVTSSKGADSTVMRSVITDNYPFVIDQINRKIYNPDSLPKGSDPKHILCNITAYYAGAVGVKSLTSDTIKVFSSTDSLDFSSPREFLIYNASSTATRTYTVTVNIHKEDSIAMSWNKMEKNTGIAALTAMKAVAIGNRIFVIGNDSEGTAVFTQGTDGMMQKLTTTTLDAEAYKNAVVKDGKIYLISGGNVMTSENGADWVAVASASSLKQLVAAGRDKIYALTANGFAESKDGSEWTERDIDADASMLPQQDITFAVRPQGVNNSVDQITVVGNRNGDKNSVTWTLIDDFGEDGQRQPWMLNVNNDDTKKLPAMTNVQTITYSDSIVALGGNPRETGTAEALKCFYYSGDGGINWGKSQYITLPEGLFSSTETFAMTVDDKNFIWLICGTSGEIWRGRINHMGWVKPQESFK